MKKEASEIISGVFRRKRGGPSLVARYHVDDGPD